MSHNQHPPELFVAERPTRSDDAIERVYARRRIVTVVVFLSLVSGLVYTFWSRGPSTPAEIPTIQAESNYRQKPAEPGGIDIPNQDMRVYDQIEGKNNAPSVEHLLPPPEEPKPAAPTVAPGADASATTNFLARDIVSSKPVETTVSSAPAPEPAPAAAVVAAPLPVAEPAAVVAAPVPTPVVVPAPTPAPAPVVVAPQPPAATVSTPAQGKKVSIDQLMGAPKSAAPVSGKVAVQLASVTSESQARIMADNLQKKYAALLRHASLHVTRADLGAKGIVYRIQSQGLAASEASGICSSLKQAKAGCILVRK